MPSRSGTCYRLPSHAAECLALQIACKYVGDGAGAEGPPRRQSDTVLLMSSYSSWLDVCTVAALPPPAAGPVIYSRDAGSDCTDSAGGGGGAVTGKVQCTSQTVSDQSAAPPSPTLHATPTSLICVRAYDYMLFILTFCHRHGESSFCSWVRRYLHTDLLSYLPV